MRSHQRAFVFLLALGLAGSTPPGAAAEESVPAPDATRVVVRGKTQLADALATATRPAWAGGAARPVLVVVDVTPYTQKAEAKIAAALASLGSEARSVPEWSLAVLGGKPTKAVADPAALGALLPGVLAKETDAVSTFTALTKTLKAWRPKGGLVVYLADWRFEDDVDLEKFIRDLAKKGRTLSVIGTEAAFRRGWNDGLRDLTERFVDDVRGFDFTDYWEGVGRDPFGGKDRRAPWHGGDTAYPYAPYRWCVTLWSTAFSASDWEVADLDGEEEDLREAVDGVMEEMARRLKLVSELAAAKEELGEVLMKILDADDPAESARLEAREQELKAEVARLEAELAAWDEPVVPAGIPDGAEDLPEELRDRLPGVGEAPPEGAEPPEWLDPDLEFRAFPLPSSFGPYGLMRAAGVTGGRYVLWSWNPAGRRNVVYEYTRCNLFPPDLRSRKDILSDLRANPWAKGILLAWATLIAERTDVLEQLPPVARNLRSASRMDRFLESDYAPSLWDSPGDQRVFIRTTKKQLLAIDRALAPLDEGIAEGGEPATAIDQRHHAEALLFRHALREARFQLSEEIEAAGLVTRADWKKDHQRGVSHRSWVRQGRDPEKIRYFGDEPYDHAAGEVLVAERKALLARLRGTPLGEELALNTIDTARPTTYERTDKVPGTGRSPTESVDTPRPTPKPPGAGSGGGGPATGGK